MTEKQEKGYLRTGDKADCYGCEACAQACPKGAISMEEDAEGFRYPAVDAALCIHCGLCNKVCPCENMPTRHSVDKYAFGGAIRDAAVRGQSTSGGAFSAIVQGWCTADTVVFGAVADGLEVYHTYTENPADIGRFRKSKYSQSRIGTAYADVLHFLKAGRRVLFSGTPCHNAGLKAYLRNKEYDNLLQVEVVCEGVPTPHYVRKLDAYLAEKYGSPVSTLDYRYKDGRKWDFQVMHIELQDGRKLKKDRWLNPYWYIWLDHLMSRPSCYACPFTTTARTADITLGDLWGVHLYCPELYYRNSGASLVIGNTPKGKSAIEAGKPYMDGHDLDFATALKYQGPLRQHIPLNDRRGACMADMMDPAVGYETICAKWARKATLKLLFQKYIWGNRQKVFMWNLLHRHKGNTGSLR